MKVRATLAKATVLLLLLLGSVALLGGCSAEQLAPAPRGVTAIYGELGTTALTPYPSDRYTVPADSRTGLRVAVTAERTTDLITAAEFQTILGEVNDCDGFSTAGGVAVSFDGPLDMRGLTPPPPEEAETAPPLPLADAYAYTAAGSPLLLVDVDPHSADRGRAHGLVLSYWTQEGDPTLADEHTIIAQPAVPLRPATRYLFVVTDQLTAADGGPVRRSPHTDELLTEPPDSAYAAQVHDGLDVLYNAVGVPAEHVVLAVSFTTRTVIDGLVELAKSVRAGPPPPLSEPWEIETPLQPDGRVRYRAVYQTADYRRPPPDSTWELGASGAPLVQDTLGLEVFMAISDAATPGPRVPVIYGHGLGGDKDGCWGAAARLSPLNVAVFSIDSPHHGSRSDDPDSLVGPVFAFFGIDPEDQSLSIAKARDNFRQMAADQLQLVRLIRSLETLDLLPPGQPDGVPDLDTSRILYLGHSFGSVQGPTIFALAPEISHAVLNVGGAGLTTLLRDSNTFSLLANALKPPGTSDAVLARFFAVIQAIVDPGDPLSYARYGTLEPLPGVPAWRPREVLLQEVIGDTIVPNSTSRALARAAGLPVLNPIEPVSGLPSVSGPQSANLESGVTGAISQFDRMDGDKTATHGELYFSAEGIAQYLEFFRTGLQHDHSTINPPY